MFQKYSLRKPRVVVFSVAFQSQAQEPTVLLSITTKLKLCYFTHYIHIQRDAFALPHPRIGS